MISLSAWRRRRLRKESLKTLSAMENPRHSWQIVARVQSPWANLIHYFITLAQLVLLMLLFGYVNQFADYIDSRGDYRNRIQEEQRQATCYLISSLEEDTKGQLQALAEVLECPEGPFDAPLAPEPVDPGGPIAPGAGDFTEGVTPGSQSGTASDSDDYGRPVGAVAPSSAPPRSDQAATTVPLAPDTPKTSEAPTLTTPGVGASQGSVVKLCIPVTRYCLSF